MLKEGDKDIKSVIRELSEMKYEMQTDKPLRDLNDQGENHDMWNTELDSMRKKVIFLLPYYGICGNSKRFIL